MSAQRPWTRYVLAATDPGPRPAAKTRIDADAQAGPDGQATPGNARQRNPDSKRGLLWRGPAAVLGQVTGMTAAPGRDSRARLPESRHGDYRLLPAAAAAWVTAAAVVRLSSSAALVCALVLTGLAVGWGLGCLTSGWVRRVARLVVLPFAVAALVSLPAAASIAARTAGPVPDAVQRQASITAVLAASSDAMLISPDRYTGKDRYLVEATLSGGVLHGESFTAETPVVVIGPASWQQVVASDTIRTAGRLLPTEPGDRAMALLIAHSSPRVTPQEGPATYPAQLRTNFVRIATEVGGQDGLLPGMVIGDRGGLDPTLEQDMQTTGLTHLTAVSGANCTYLLVFVFLAVRALRAPRLVAAVLGIVALIGFVILVRPEPSVLRAAVMGGLGVVAVLTGRGKVPFALLLLAVVVLLTADPWLNNSYAFLLSVAAAAGLILFGPVLATRLSSFMPVAAAQVLSVPIAAQLCCTPILILLQPTLPLYSLPANIAATPVVPVVTIVGMLAVALVAIAEPLAIPLVVVAGWGAGWVGSVARFFGAAPGAAVPWVGGAAGAVLTGVLSLAVIVAVVWGPRVWSALRRRARPGTATSTARDAPRSRGTAAAWIAGGVAIGLAAVFLWPLQRDVGNRWHLATCDVGQGDAFAVRTGEHKVILVDTGPEPDDVDACLDRLSVTTVELLVLTHLHADHYGGIEGVFRDRTVERVLYSTSEPVLPAEVTTAVVSNAPDSGDEADVGASSAPPGKLTAGMSGSHGDDGYARVSWTVIWPEPGARPNSENNSSAVLEVTIDTPSDGGISVLLTGDLEEDAAAALLLENPDLVERGVQILKVAHHGAQNGGLELARAVRPRLAMISAGRDNDYGHPHPSITAGLSAAGIAVARTDELGSFLVSIQDNSLRVRRRRAVPLCRSCSPWHS
ncbi:MULTISPECIES: ComEC/Rec2 family competence protein [unclassified Arthrobacter]|uniref:ComEC/Rec2 family competence protein n=1 Tax=unclassified Arthrobacter TaxID=235627 RepID=UPI001490CE8F|nr:MULTISPECIES: ComEC/Rec2 family competence protein [unclassified Arthrobacter]MBE0009792.1 MBL fold metallo-hydrolase [Arthrobacter sp. AET 35A]NOJ63708.1 MBL fold metallo-hydrolase [Arthrobacter sp. 147(2020)]